MWRLILNVLIGFLVGALKRVFVFIVAWVAAPSVLFVLMAWMLLHDSDFGLWLVSYKPENSHKEETYFEEKVCWITGKMISLFNSIDANLVHSQVPLRRLVVVWRISSRKREPTSFCQVVTH